MTDDDRTMGELRAIRSQLSRVHGLGLVLVVAVVVVLMLVVRAGFALEDFGATRLGRLFVRKG